MKGKKLENKEVGWALIFILPPVIAYFMAVILLEVTGTVSTGLNGLGLWFCCSMLVLGLLCIPFWIKEVLKAVRKGKMLKQGE